MRQAARNRSDPISPCSNGATKMPSGLPASRRARLALRGERQLPQVVAIERQNVESVELHLAVMLARVQSIEISDAIYPEYYRLAVNDKALLPVPQSAFHDPRISVGPIVATTGDQAHAVPAFQPEPVPVILHFMEPIGAIRNDAGLGRKAKFKGTSDPP